MSGAGFAGFAQSAPSITSVQTSALLTTIFKIHAVVALIFSYSLPGTYWLQYQPAELRLAKIANALNEKYFSEFGVEDGFSYMKTHKRQTQMCAITAWAGLVPHRQAYLHSTVVSAG